MVNIKGLISKCAVLIPALVISALVLIILVMVLGVFAMYNTLVMQSLDLDIYGLDFIIFLGLQLGLLLGVCFGVRSLVVYCGILRKDRERG